MTITLDEEVARWARIEAAKRDTSVSRLVGAMLAEKMASKASYEAAREQFFAVRPRPLGPPRQKLPKREALYDRAGLR
jgi:hypothetical protein